MAARKRAKRTQLVVGLFALCSGVFVAGYKFGEFDSCVAPHGGVGMLFFIVIIAATPLICASYILLKRAFSSDAHDDI